MVDAAQNTSQEIEQDATESLQTSNYFLAEVINKSPEKEVTSKSVTNEKGAGEPRENICDSDKLVDDMMAHKNILLFKVIIYFCAYVCFTVLHLLKFYFFSQIMEDENETLKKENQVRINFGKL